ncbi:hypothetical protein GCM10023088_12070 [Actinomadura verrucosospora]
MTNTSDARPGSAANGERTTPNNPHMQDEMRIAGGRFTPAAWARTVTGLTGAYHPISHIGPD